MGQNSSGDSSGDSSASVTNCYNTGNVSCPDSGSDNNVGGVVGYNSFGVTVTNCYNTGKVSGPDSGSGNSVGGVVGYNDSGTVENSYNTGKVSGPDSGTSNYVGGVVGYNISSVTNCYNTGSVSGPDSGSGSYVGGVVGYNISSVTNCYFLKTADVNENLSGIGSGKPSEENVKSLTAEEFAIQSSFTNSSWDFANTWEIKSIFGRPTLQDNAEIGGTANNPYKIFTATQLAAFRDLVNGEDGNPNAHAKLMNNIDLSSVCGAELSNGQPVSWTPIGSFSNSYEGTFDGNGHTIENLYINNTSSDYQGLFGRVNGGTVQDLTVSGSVSGHWYVGGVVGYNNGGNVTGCIFSGSGSVSVTGSDHVGGVVGYNHSGGTVKNCYNTGAVKGSGNSVGGVVGYNQSGSSVTTCYNTGTVSGSDHVGGVVGSNGSNGSVEKCHNTGKVSGRYVGGVVGSNSGTVENCYNTDSVSDGTTSGGVVGQNSGSVTNCYFLQTTEVNDKLQGIGGGSGTSSNVEARTDDAFHSGEVAHLLQGTQTTPVWGQSDLTMLDSWPTLIALDNSAQTVYKVITDYGYVEQPNNVSYTNNPATPSETPSREGYTFDSWQKTTGEGNTITYTAKWTAIPATYTVTFDSQGGSAVSDQTVTEGQTITEPAAPTRDGYTFKGWFTEASGGSQWNFSTAVTENMTLYAQWTAVEEPIPTPTPTPDPEPSGPSTGDSTGWDDIRDELENAENGDEITIDMGDETKVPAEIFESLAGKDVEISFDLGDIQWSVNGADIPTDTDFTDLDLGASLGTSGIPVNVINTITGEVGTVQITLAHNGEFGFTMTLTAPLGKENAGYWANLYHYDESAEALNFEAAAKIDEDGSVTIPFSHASQYAIVIDTHSHATVDVSDLFIDVAPNAWYKDAVQYAYDNGLMTGVSATEFAPEQTTTRAMIVSILARLEGVTTAEAAGFADVDDNDWYATAVNWAANVGVVNGYEDNTFRPNTAITREQLAAILMNYAAYKGEDVSNRADLTSYTDQPSTWAEEAMQWAVAEGLISGVTNDQLQPQGNATRAQVAAILQRFLDK